MSAWQEEWSEWILRQPWRGSANHRTAFAAGWLMGEAQLATAADDLAFVRAELEAVTKQRDAFVAAEANRNQPGIIAALNAQLRTELDKMRDDENKRAQERDKAEARVKELELINRELRRTIDMLRGR